MIKEAIILAGGLGTRLKSTVPDLPKSLANIAGRPFLFYIINYLRLQGVERFIFSLGYKAGLIEDYLKEAFALLEYEIVVEEKPLGTGGAIYKALDKSKYENVVITNGDSLFRVDLGKMASFHNEKTSKCTLALKYMQNFDRYGVVELEDEECIKSFKEKSFYAEGWINGGLYILNKDFFLNKQFPERFSFENEFLELYSSQGNFYGFKSEGYFIDIGIPEDYRKAEFDFSTKLDLVRIDKSWTVFLDRDGVINEEKADSYIFNYGEFVFTDKALEAIKIISDTFNRVIIVSNQRGVGRSLMTIEDLHQIHKEMQKETEAVGGRIDGIYFCTEVDNRHFNRKPNPGMARQAAADFPDIDLQKSIMVGNKLSDMRFGKAAGMYTVYIKSTHPHQPFPHPDIDIVFESLFDFAKAVKP